MKYLKVNFLLCILITQYMDDVLCTVKKVHVKGTAMKMNRSKEERIYEV